MAVKHKIAKDTPPAVTAGAAAVRRQAAAEPLYVQLASEVRRQIDNGMLRAGARLPSIRTVRRMRRVSAATAIEAYLRLERDGYVRARDRSGFYVIEPPGHAYPEPRAATALAPPVEVGVGGLVLETLRQHMNPKLTPLGVALPGPSFFPNARVNRMVRRVAARSPLHAATYSPAAGEPVLRREIARLLFGAGVSVSPDDVVIMSGGMEALTLSLRAVASPGDVVAVESPTYFGLLQAAESLGVRVIEVPSDPRLGIDFELLERAIRRHRVKALLSMTTCHNPLGTVMSNEAKADLVNLLGQYRVTLIEDDIYGDLAFAASRPPAAKAFDRQGLVLLCGSMSKVLAPGLRVGWVAAGRMRDRIELLKSISTLSTATLPQLVIAEILQTGFYARHVRRLSLQLADHVRRYSHAISAAFPAGTRLTRPAGGSLLWIQLPGRKDGTLLQRRALEHGISIMPGEIFSAGAKHRGYIRMSCGAAWTPAIERAIEQVGKLCRDLQR